MRDVLRRETTGVASGVVAHLSGAIVVGAVVAVDPGGWYPFGPTKWLAVSTLIAATATYAAWCGLRPRLPAWSGVAWMALLVTAVLAAVFGRDPLYAWTGTPERHLGVLAWVLFGVCFAIGSLLDASESVGRWSRWVVVATVWCAGYAVVERWFGAPIETGATTARLGGPFGSAAYFGAALCLLVPISAGVAVDAGQSRRWRLIAGAAAVGGLVALFGTGSRAAWIGLLASAAVVAVVIRPARRTVLVAVAAGVAALALVAPRLDDVLTRDVGATSRLDEWAVGWRIVAAHPVLGVGPEGYRTALADGVTAEYERSYGRQVLPDRAHNAPLDVAASLGVAGAVAYLVLTGGVVVAAVRAMRRSPLYAGLSAGVLAYLTQQMFLFPLAEIDPVLWLAAGALVTSNLTSDLTSNLTSNRAPHHALHSAPRPSSRRPQAPYRDAAEPERHPYTRWAICATGAVLTVALFTTGVLGVAADRAAQAGTLAGAHRAVELRPDVVRYRLLVAALARRDGTLRGVDEAIDSALAALDISPHDPVAQQAAAAALSHRAMITGDTDDIARALDRWAALVAADRLCADCQLGLGQAAALAGDADLALQAWTQAAALARPGDTRAADALARLDEARS